VCLHDEAHGRKAGKGALKAIMEHLPFIFAESRADVDPSRRLPIGGRIDSRMPEDFPV
jgi:hypothetical protein